MNVYAKMEKPSLGRMGTFNYGMLEMLCFTLTRDLAECKAQVVVWFIYCNKTELGFFLF